MASSDMLFNVDNGYLEGLVRGFRGGILSQADYLNLTQCETLEGKVENVHERPQSAIIPHKARLRCSLLLVDLKLHLQSTDYGNFLQNEAGPLTVAVVDDKLREKLVTEFTYFRNHSLPPLSQFFDFIT